MTNSLKKRFVKDNGLNINVFEEPYFTQRLNQFQKLPKYFNIKLEYELFKEMIDKDFNNDENHFFNRIGSLQKKVIEDIKTAPGYEEYNSVKIKSENHFLHDIKNQDIYIQPNIDKCFVSIDLVKANFQVLKKAFLKEDYGVESYKDLIQRSCKKEYSERFVRYILGSKYFRQVIFGNTNPKRQQALQKKVMNDIVGYLLNNDFNKEEFISKTADEVLLEGDSVYTDWDQLSHDITKFIGYDIRVEIFRLEQIGTKSHYLKRDLFTDEIIDIKGVEGFIYPQVLRRLFNEKITEDDKVFLAEKRLAKFLGEYDESIRCTK